MKRQMCEQVPRSTPPDRRQGGKALARTRCSSLDEATRSFGVLPELSSELLRRKGKEHPVPRFCLGLVSCFCFEGASIKLGPTKFEVTFECEHKRSRPFMACQISFGPSSVILKPNGFRVVPSSLNRRMGDGRHPSNFDSLAGPCCQHCGVTFKSTKPISRLEPWALAVSLQCGKEQMWLFLGESRQQSLNPNCAICFLPGVLLFE